MLKAIPQCAGVALSIVAVVVTAEIASAASKKITYEEAYKRCLAYIDSEKGGLAKSGTSEQTRVARAQACMKKFGYRV
ncbi:MAG: hypothetical protein AB7G35_13910 [Hyphomicrobiaceae bacterium]